MSLAFLHALNQSIYSTMYNKSKNSNSMKNWISNIRKISTVAIINKIKLETKTENNSSQ